MSLGAPRRARDERLARSVAVACFVVACAVGDARTALAEWQPSGAVTGGFLVQSGRNAGRPTMGGGIAADLWQAFGALRLGFTLGLHAVSGDPDESMVFTPIAFSGAVVLDAPRASFEIRIRGGGFTGAVHDFGFVGGLYLGAGVFLDIALSDEAALGFGGDLHLLVAGERSANFDSRAFFAPGITLVYRPSRGDDAP